MKVEVTRYGTLEHWTPDEVAVAFDHHDIVLIDVRTPQEFSYERIDGALLAPLQVFDPAHMPDQHSKRIVFCCEHGARSRDVARRCLMAGTERIAHLAGGLRAWKAAGLEFTGTNMSSGAPARMTMSRTTF